MPAETNTVDKPLRQVTMPAFEVPSHPAFERLLAHLPQEVRASLTPVQRTALAEATWPIGTEHRIDYRASVWFVKRRFYVRLLVGNERRTLSRLVREKQIDLVKTTVIALLSVWLFASLVLLAGVVGLYLLKSALGVDLFEGPSFLHYCFFN